MSNHAPVFAARSWLFAPGDSDRKMQKAIAGEADIVVCDLEDAVAEAEKPKARSLVSEFIASHAEQRARLWVRINPLDGPHAVADLVAVVGSRPGGIMLPKSRGRTDVDTLDHYLTALEVAAGIEPDTIKLIVLVTETAQGMYTTGTYVGAPRLVAMTWGAEDLATALGAVSNRNPDGSYDFTSQMARSFCLLGASLAGVAPIETILSDFRDDAALLKRTTEVRRAGYRGMLAIHPAQVPIINAAFTPSAEELASARIIVDLFAANPGAGTIGYEGAMLDRPHLARAQAVLALGKPR